MGNRASRKLAVIIHADVVSSTSLVQLDETLAHERIQGTFHRFSDTIKRYNGNPLEIRGDALVAEFPRASDALCASMAFQKANSDHVAHLTDEIRPVLRVGIAMGEVVVADHTVTGGGVVLAQRLEQLAEPGGVVIQGAAHETVPKRLPFNYKDLGEIELKGFDDPVRACSVQIKAGENIPNPERQAGKGLEPFLSSTRNRILAGSLAALLVITGIWFSPPFSSKQEESTEVTTETKVPSLLVLPFANKSDDPSQDYFVDGISEDIITSFSRLSNLTVLAWNTSSSFKGKTVQPQEISKELGVSFILDGSVRKAGDQLRITAELVDAGNGKQLWADRYDRKLADVFALQDEVTQKIVQALSLRLTAAEKGQLGHSGTNNLEAYDFFLQGLQYNRQQTKESAVMARAAFSRALELDPSYARAYGGLAIITTRETQFGYANLTPTEGLSRALQLAQKAVELDPNSPETNWTLGFVHMFRKEYDKAESATKKAIELSPNYADGYGLLSFIENWQGNAKDAERYILKAMKLNPYYSYDYPWNLGLSKYLMGQYEEATKGFQDALGHNESAIFPRLFLAASYVRLGRLDDASWEIEQLSVQSPDTKVSQLANTIPLKDKEKLTMFLDDLRKAGMAD